MIWKLVRSRFAASFMLSVVAASVLSLASCADTAAVKADGGGADDNPKDPKKSAAERRAERAKTFRAATPRKSETIFSPLTLPEPNLIRGAAGVPGPEYWQQSADYSIQATLDTEARKVTASESLTYTNNSPDTLSFLWFNLEQNTFKPDSLGSLMRTDEGRFGNRNPFNGGFVITSVKVNGTETSIAVYDTLGRVDLRKPLAPKGGVVKVEFEWSFLIPEKGADRMGIYASADGPIFQMAQWFPAVAMYDDVHGWNARPYLGQGEFYTNHGTFNVSLTVPRNHIVAGSGVLQNPTEVLTPTQIERLAAAAKTKTTTMIRDENEVNDAASRPAGEGPLTWKFKGQNIRTFAWTSSEAFIWDAAGIDWGDGTSTLCQSLYSKDALPLWKEKSTDSLRFSIEHYSEKWFRYPYPIATNVNGVVGGMEYPMIIYCSERQNEDGLFGVTTHEIGHNWFPMTVNTDERYHAWMDEGFNTFINYYASQARKPDTESKNDAEKKPERRQRRGDARSFAPAMLAPVQQPIMTPADQVVPYLLGQLQYGKTATGLVILREVILGPARFDPAFKRYVSSWAFKSPQPADFFRCMENAAGADLAWFWRGWFMETGTLDQSIKEVKYADDGQALVTIENLGELVMPATLRCTLDDGSEIDRQVPVQAWFYGNRFTTRVNTGGKKITKAVLDPDEQLPDVDAENNTWEIK